MASWDSPFRWAKEGFLALGSALLEPECPLCDTPVFFHPGSLLCPACEKDLLALRLSGPVCSCCALPIKDGETDPCVECRLDPLALQRTSAFFSYEGAVRSLLVLWKKRANPGLRRYLLRIWASSLQEGLPPFPPGAVVVGVEPHPNRLLARGFDPVLPFVRSLSKSFCIPTLRALVRTHDAPHQAALPAREREKNVKGSFLLRSGMDREIQGRPVVLVDDVMTTGATLNEAAKALRKAKPGYILGVVFARTLKGRQGFPLLSKPRG